MKTGLVVALLVVALLALATGSVHIPATEIAGRLARAATGQGTGDTADQILLQVRLPRVALAIAVGAALALGGLASQTLFRNPLATPSIIGVSNGAALGAVAAMLAGIAAPLGSFAAGLAVAALVFTLGRRGTYFGQTLLLAGIAIAALCSALTTGALYLAGERLPAVIFWLMGGLWQANGRAALVMLPVALAALGVMLALARSLNVVLVGEASARDLGVNVPRLQYTLLALITVTAATAVSLTGVIGFIGLIVPHLLRLAVGGDHRRLVPATALGGALLLLMADTLARTLAAPAEIPVGILTALVGAPVFLWLLRRRRTL
ncbi:MAG: Hemin transport system permease protein HmuU [Verrucomicrobiae bacterium]|nr:Hemin transport system permease protein HmuU [Verrucomicrobiae bacterium]